MPGYALVRENITGGVCVQEFINSKTQLHSGGSQVKVSLLLLGCSTRFTLAHFRNCQPIGQAITLAIAATRRNRVSIGCLVVSKLVLVDIYILGG